MTSTAPSKRQKSIVPELSQVNSRSVSLPHRFFRKLRRLNLFPIIVENIILRLYPPGRVQRRRFVVKNFDKVFCGSIDNYIDYHIYFFGGYDLAGLDLASALFRHVGVRDVVDIGGNVGNHALFFSRYARQVYCFEPNPPILAKLRDNVRRSNALNVTCLGYGLSDRSGQLDFFQNADRNLGAGSFESVHPNVDLDSKESLTVNRGDDVLPALCQEVDYVKIDVEGHEARVLDGMQSWATNVRPVFDFEFGATLRAVLKNQKTLEAHFPPNYLFFGAVSAGGGVCRLLQKRRYVLQQFRFSRDYAHVIGIPAEKIGQLNLAELR